MEKNDGCDSPAPEALSRFDALIQERVNAGYEIPCGWIFRGLTLLFHQANDERRSKSNNGDGDEGEAAEGNSSIEQPCRLRLGSNIASFAGAHVLTSSSNPSSSITHVVVDPDIASSELSSVRGSWAANVGKKMPHLVTVEWVEESWKQRTLVDEESMFLSLTLQFHIPLIDL